MFSQDAVLVEHAFRGEMKMKIDNYFESWKSACMAQLKKAGVDLAPSKSEWRDLYACNVRPRDVVEELKNLRAVVVV